MTFSVLYPEPAPDPPSGSTAPDFFVDLNLDQIVEAVVKEKDEYALLPFFYAPLESVTAIAYRHDVFRDLERPGLLGCVRDFGEALAAMRKHLAFAAKIRHRHEANAWFLEAVDMYCSALTRFGEALSSEGPSSSAFRGLRVHLERYVASESFRSLLVEKEHVHEALSQIDYAIVIRDAEFTVRKYTGEPDYSAEVDETFAKFKQGAAKDYRVSFKRDFPDMNHIEQQVLTFVAQLYPNEFEQLDTFCQRSRNYLDSTVARFDREIQFYLAYAHYIAPLKSSGLQFCYPAMTQGSDKNIYDREAFDIALARKLQLSDSKVVCNDFSLSEPERLIVVTGPNQGGKTTFARAFGQIHYLAALGCPVPGSEARLYLFDKLFTQFEREESIENLRGKLEDDLCRLRSTLAEATDRSILILNEIFNSTTLADAVFLSKEIMERLSSCDTIGIWVTFIDELASFNDKTVSMVSTVVPENPAQRTFKVIRRQADGLAYALAIAEKHRVTYRALHERIRS